MSTSAERKPEQLVLELGHRPALGSEDFLVSDCNHAAVQHIDDWPGWAHPASVVAGPPRSGKSHLAQVWTLRSGAAVVPASALSDGTVQLLETAGALCVEDIDRGIASERVLFHLLNLAREQRRFVLMTSRAMPGEIAIGLPDLRSRLRAAAVVRIEPPDDALLRAVLVKLFADRQLAIEPNVISHLALHMDRSIQCAEQVVAAADRMALARGRRVSRTLAAEALQSVAEAREAE